MQIQPFLHKLSHLLYTTKRIVHTLRGVTCDEGDQLVKFDVKDYFLSGDHDALAADACDHLNGTQRQLTKDVLNFLLATQYVKTRLDEDRLWICTCGTGMGLPHSADVADSAFYHRVEVSIVLKH